MPTTKGLLKLTAGPRQYPIAPHALSVSRRVLAIEREGWLTWDPSDVLATLTPAMRERVRELVPRVAAWLARVT